MKDLLHSTTLPKRVNHKVRVFPKSNPKVTVTVKSLTEEDAEPGDLVLKGTPGMTYVMKNYNGETISGSLNDKGFALIRKENL